MRVTEKLIALSVFALSFCSSQLLAQTTPVYTDPTTSQTVAQPTGTGFGLSLTNSSQIPVTLNTQSLNCLGPGYSFGNSGTSANGWYGCYMNNWNMLENSSGITNMIGETFVKNAIGDSAFLYGYNTRFGGATAASDEGANNITLHSNQIGWMHGNLDPLQLGYTFGYADLPSGVTYLNSLGGAPYT